MNDSISDPNPHIAPRFAAKADTGLILRFIRQLAVYEKLTREVQTAEACLRHWLFQEPKIAEMLIAEPASISKICSSNLRFTAKARKPGQGSVAAVAWNGGLWTGTTHKRFVFAPTWGPNPWMRGTFPSVRDCPGGFGNFIRLKGSWPFSGLAFGQSALKTARGFVNLFHECFHGGAVANGAMSFAI